MVWKCTPVRSGSDLPAQAKRTVRPGSEPTRRQVELAFGNPDNVSLLWIYCLNCDRISTWTVLDPGGHRQTANVTVLLGYGQCSSVNVTRTMRYRYVIDNRHHYMSSRHTYREIGGQKDYAVFGHCVIQCP